jgi:hypothetical protein
MKTIVVEIPDNISVKAAMRAIKDIIFVSLGSSCTVRELPDTDACRKAIEFIASQKDKKGNWAVVLAEETLKKLPGAGEN